MKYTVILTTIITSIFSTNFLPDVNSKLDATISYIYSEMQKTQWKQDINATHFRIGEDKGLYKSYIHVNIMDETNSLAAKALREYASVPDQNMFVTSFVVYAILETYRYEGIKELDRDSLDDALNQLIKYLDKNYDDVPYYTFWKQININGTWSQHPDNMCMTVENMEYFTSDKIINLFEKLGFEKVVKLLKLGQGLRGAFEYAYPIPSDMDDTSINLGITGILHNMTDTFGNSTDYWFEKNGKMKELFDYIKFYSYQPFNYEIEDMNLIDPRSYFVLQDFLTEQYNKNNTNIRLPTTWVLNYTMQRKIAPIISMPFSVNNVDFNVAANFLFGMTNILLFHRDQEYIRSAFDDEMKNLYQTTADLLTWTVKNDRMKKRPDLSLLYYPSIFDFYWLVSRTCSTLENFNFDNDPDRDYFLVIKSQLEDVLKNEGTEQIMSRMNKSDKGVYFMELLGDYANYTRCEDCVFATGLALNSLLNIWTTETRDAHRITGLKYVESHSNFEKYNIREVVDDIAKYLVNSFDTLLGPDVEGAFFSGSVKNMASIAYFFPSNFNFYYNGTTIPDTTDPKYLTWINMVSAMKAYVSDDVYNELLQKVWYGQKVPAEEQYLNNVPFPYWSSPGVTYAINLLGLSKYKKLEK
jgi:hypothetical protein